MQRMRLLRIPFLHYLVEAVERRERHVMRFFSRWNDVAYVMARDQHRSLDDFYWFSWSFGGVFDESSGYCGGAWDV